MYLTLIIIVAIILILKRLGHSSLEIDFSKATTENISIICYGRFWNIFQVDKARNVLI